MVIALVAVLPRRAVPVAWVLLGVAVLLSPLFDLDVSQWLADASPFAHQKAPARRSPWSPSWLCSVRRERWSRPAWRGSAAATSAR